MYGISDYKFNVVKLLSHKNRVTGNALELGINMVSKREGNNALHFAFEKDKVSEETIDLLLLNGISVKHKNKNGKDPYEIAMEKGHWIYVLQGRFKQLGESRGEKVEG